MSIGPGYTCADCKVIMRPRKNEVWVQVNDSEDDPYQIWCADLWECPECERQVILGYGQQPVATRHEDHFKDYQSQVTHIIDGTLRGLK